MESWQRFRVLIRSHSDRFLVLTSRGLEFVTGWFGTSGRVPSPVTTLYQLLLRIVSMGGVMSLQLAYRVGYRINVIEKAVSNDYVELNPVSKRLEKKVLKRIKNMVGEPPRELYIYRRSEGGVGTV